MDLQAVAAEVARAEEALVDLVGDEIATITVNSLDAEDAPFLGLVVSKLSPICGNLLERKITDLLTDESADHGLRWIRQDPDFPDALLVDRDGLTTDNGYEVKAWYTLSTELTGRFRESVNLLAPRNIRVVIIAWHMSHIVYGTPKIVGVLTVDAERVARCRDRHYHNPPDYLCVEPEDTTGRTRNLQQTNVLGYKFQGTKSEFAEAQAIVDRSSHSGAEPHTSAGIELTTELMNAFPYRLDSNFAKIDRIDHPDIEAFKARVLSESVRGRTLRQWIQLLRALSDSGRPAAQAAAAKVIQDIYDEL